MRLAPLRIIFYAPFKPLGHAHPSGDLVTATGIFDFLINQGHRVYGGKFASMPLDILEALVMAEIDLGAEAGRPKVLRDFC